MKTQELLAIVEKRGLKVTLKDGRPFLVPGSNGKEVTDKLLAVLKIHRDQIIRTLSGNGAK